MAANESSKPRGRKSKALPKKRGDYIAAARFNDNQTQLYFVRNADDIDDARRMVLEEVGYENVRCLLVSERKTDNG